MRLARQLHTYFGVFFAPSFIFFAFTGFLQTYSWHEGKNPARWIVMLEQIHTHQRMVPYTPPSTPAPATNAAAITASAATAPGAPASAPTTAQASPTPSTTPPTPPPWRKRSMPMRIFMGFMAVGLISVSLVGLWMGYQLRQPALISTLLLAGTIIPFAALYIGTRS